MEKQIEIGTPEGRIDTWVFHPDGPGRWPAVILHTDVKSVRPALYEAARHLVSLGYAVLLPNMYYRVARAPVVDPAASIRDPIVRATLNGFRESVTPAGLRSDHGAMLDFLAAQPFVLGDKVAVLGYCMSGTFALRAAADFPDRVVAAASLHGGRLATDDPDSPHLGADRMRARLYLGYARDDASMPDEMIERLEKALTEAGVDFTSDHYDALHGFAVIDGPAYDEAAERKHWQAVEKLLESTLKAA